MGFFYIIYHNKTNPDSKIVLRGFSNVDGGYIQYISEQIRLKEQYSDILYESLIQVAEINHELEYSGSEGGDQNSPQYCEGCGH